MISLVGGELYQWDTGRIVRVVPDENVKVHEVHFSTKRMDYAYVLKTYIVDGVTYCAIPNIILQQSNRLLCYEVCENSDGEETIANTYFDIIKRNRPEDYVYTEQDHFTIQALSNRVDKLEESSHTHINKTELDTITKEDLETWRSPNSSAITGGAQVGTLFEDLEVTTTLAEDASEWTSASSQPFKCTFRPSPGQMVVVKVKDLDVDTITTAKIPPTGYPLGQTIIGNYSVVNSRLQSWYNDADSVPPTPNDAQANSCLVFEDQYYDSEHLTPSLPTCILYTKTPGTYKVTVTTLKHSIGPESVVKMYDVRPSTFAEYGTYTNWKDLTKSGKYDLWEVSIKKTNYYNGVYLKEVNGTKYIYVYRSEQKKDPESGIFTTTDYTLTYDTATETVTCSDATINPETDVIISVHLDQVISTVPDNATSLGKPSADKVGKMLTTVDLGEGVIDNKWQSRRYEYQWVDVPTGGSENAVTYAEQTLTDTQKSQARENIGAVGAEDVLQSDWAQNDATAKDYVKNRPGGFSTFTEEEVEIQYGGDHAVGVNWGNAGGLLWVLAHSSDEIPTKEELAGATYTGTMTTQKALNVYDAGDKCYYANESGSITTSDPPPYAIVVTEAGTVVWGRTFSKAGVYLPQGTASFMPNPIKVDTLTYMKKTETPHAFPAKYIPPLEPLTVTFTKDDDGNWSADKTFAEVKAAIEAGRFVQAVPGDYGISLPACIANDQQVVFSLSFQENNVIMQIFAVMTPTFCDVEKTRGGLLPLDDTPVYEGKLAEKTDDMTQPVGVDADGKLWTKPGGGSVTADGITTALGYTPRKAWYVKLTGTKASPTADQTAAAIYQAYTDGYAVYGIVQISEILEGFPIILPLLYVYGSSASVGALCFAGSANPHLSGTITQNTTVTATYDGSWHAFVDSQPTALKNPNALTIKLGSETITYDGSSAQTVEIADGTEVSY